jgi:hypothetical protein
VPYVPVPKNLDKVKVKVFFGLTKRQILCFGLGAALGVPFYLLTRKALGNDISLTLMVIIMMPFFFMGMYEKDGQPAEKVLRNIIRTRFLWPGIRTYKTENLLETLEKKDMTENDKK